MNFSRKVLICGLLPLISSCGGKLPVKKCVATIGFIEIREAVKRCSTDECIDKAIRAYIVADCLEPDKTFSVLPAEKIDGSTVITPEDEKTLLLFIRQKCRI